MTSFRCLFPFSRSNVIFRARKSNFISVSALKRFYTVQWPKTRRKSHFAPGPLPEMKLPSSTRRNLALLSIGAGGLAVSLWWLIPPSKLLLDTPTAPAACIHSNDLQVDDFDNGAPRTVAGRIKLFLILWIIEPALTTFRFLHITIIFLPVVLTSPLLLAELFTSDTGKERRKVRRKRKGKNEDPELATTVWWYAVLVNSMERAGPTFIKLAQWAGSRTDLFPPTLCALFGRLHSNGKAHSLAYTKKTLEKAFGLAFEEIFIEFDETPVGIGAVAQVYKGVLHPQLLSPSYLHPSASISPLDPALVFIPGDVTPPHIPSSTVAIKIIHPHVRSMISRDLKIMSTFANIINVIPSLEWLSLPQEVEVFGELMQSQTDLRKEGGNLERFEENFKRRYGVVGFPRPLKEYTTESVLVEEYEDAIPLSAFLDHGGGPFDERIANLGLDAFLTMLLIDNFAHADLHPGNIMIKFYKPATPSLFGSLKSVILGKMSEPSAPEEDPSSKVNLEVTRRLKSYVTDDGKLDQWLDGLENLDKEGYQPELVFIDAGLITELNDLDRKNFIDLFGAVARFDGYLVGKLMVERCRTPDLVIDEELFALKMQNLVLSIKSKTFSLAQFKLADLLTEVLKNVRMHHVKLEADFVNTVLSILLLEGIGRQLDPGMDLFKSALPILRQLGKQMSNKEAILGAVESGSLTVMLKLWFWIEAREIASLATTDVDALVRDDLLTPNM